MDLDHEDLNASRLFLLPVLVLLVIFVCRTFSVHFHRLRRIRLHGCAPPPNLPQIDPVFGLEKVIQALRSFRSNKGNASLEPQFTTYGTTFLAQVYNTTKIYTIAPQNLQLSSKPKITAKLRFWSSCKLASAFVESCVAQASASLRDAATEEPSRLILAHQLAAQTSDHEDIVNQLLNVILPAHDATAVALTNTFLQLSRHPIAYARLRQEILAIGPCSTWTFERLKACKYLQAVLNETFPLNPSIGQMNRVALRDILLPIGGGYEGTSPVFVKKGTVSRTNFYALHRSPPIWSQDSDMWRPERWLQKGRDELVKLGHWTFLPFGGGARICIGMQLALTEVAYAVGRLAQRYQRVDCRDPVWDFVEEWKITT
ncbi:MAG: hypothetical protein L6R42_005386, partial [Xanthoria sp. 1 TBL-2021]